MSLFELPQRDIGVPANFQVVSLDLSAEVDTAHGRDRKKRRGARCLCDVYVSRNVSETKLSLLTFSESSPRGDVIIR